MMLRPASWVVLMGASVATADATEWCLETTDFQSHVGTLVRFDAQRVDLHTADGSTRIFPLKSVLRLGHQELSEPSPDVAADVDVAVGQMVKVNGLEMTVTSTNASRTVLSGPDGQQRTWLTSIVRQIMAATAARHRRGPLMLELNDGEQLIGTPLRLDNSVLVWSSDLLGDWTVPPERLQRLVRLPIQSPPATNVSEDAATLANGDVVRGIVAGLSSAAVSLQSTGGAAIDVPLDSVRSIQFASSAALPIPPAGGWIVDLNDQSRVLVSMIEMNERGWTVQRSDDHQQPLRADAIQAMERVGGAVLWLSDLSPRVATSRTPFGREWPAQMNQAVDGGPLRFENRAFRHGIGVHAYSKLVFDLPSGYDRLHLSYAIAGEGPYADVTVRVSLDQHVVLSVEHVRVGTLATPQLIPLDQAKSLTLEVDYGDNQDVQDRFNWLEPALTRAMP